MTKQRSAFARIFQNCITNSFNVLTWRIKAQHK